MYYRKKGICTFAAMGVIISAIPLSANAAPVSEMPIATSPTGSVSVGMPRAGYNGSIQKTSEGQSFSSAWQLSATSGSDATLIYGYNTAWINEDYSWAYHNVREHSAEVQNSNGAFGSSKKKKTEVAKIEVRHSGNSVIYQNTWYDFNKKNLLS